LEQKDTHSPGYIAMCRTQCFMTEGLRKPRPLACALYRLSV